MSAKNSLSSEERAFFSLVKSAVTSNPFSDNRVEIDLKLAGLEEDAPKEKRIARVIAAVREKLEGVEKRGAASIRKFSGEDHQLIKSAVLFDFFYRYRKQFDQLILEQLEKGGPPIKPSFAREGLQALAGYGLDPAYTFALCYQLRRAYYFIDRGVVGRSPAMKELRRALWNNVFTHDIELFDQFLWDKMEDFSTLLLGETGAGKGTAALAIGRSGFIPYDEQTNNFAESFARSFIAINLSQFPETLIESELFGHKKGAFTGAMEDHDGVFARCSPYGAIFLDEIGEVSIPVQIKLLQVLEERLFSPVGSHDRIRFAGRIIAATNKPISQIRDKKVLRDDLYYRLCSDVITVPPLRRRISEDPAELDDLLHHTIRKMAGKDSRELVGMVREEILQHPGPDYSWPGNVRELEQCVRSILLKRRYEGDLFSVASDLRSTIIEGIETGGIAAQDLITGYCNLLYQRYGTFEEVARRTRLDRRTVKKHIKLSAKTEK